MKTMLVCALAVLLAGCVAVTPGTPISDRTAAPASVSPTVMVTPTQIAAAVPSQCGLTAVAAPVLPTSIPGYNELDPATGLHMTGDVQKVGLEKLDPARYRLQVTGKVDHPLSLTYDDLRCMPKAKTNVPLICSGYFVDVANWGGTPLAGVLEKAGVQPGATQISLVSADGYWNLERLDVATAPDNLLAYEWEGQTLPVLHGFPVRAVLPTEEGSKWVKWLVQIDVR
jgi:DMSO/TMAO reductase YedYZ molybdopterin-dependent catalytic subunit